MPEPAHSWLSVRLLLGVPFQRAVCHFSRGLRSRKSELSQPFRLLFAATPFIVGDFVRKSIRPLDRGRALADGRGPSDP